MAAADARDRVVAVAEPQDAGFVRGGDDGRDARQPVQVAALRPCAVEHAKQAPAQHGDPHGTRAVARERLHRRVPGLRRQRLGDEAASIEVREDVRSAEPDGALQVAIGNVQLRHVQVIHHHPAANLFHHLRPLAAGSPEACGVPGGDRKRKLACGRAIAHDVALAEAIQPVGGADPHVSLAVLQKGEDPPVRQAVPRGKRSADREPARSRRRAPAQETAREPRRGPRPRGCPRDRTRWAPPHGPHGHEAPPKNPAGLATGRRCGQARSAPRPRSCRPAPPREHSWPRWRAARHGPPESARRGAGREARRRWPSTGSRLDR
jgi:hypothetical protein